jgi:hypothetical protein
VVHAGGVGEEEGLDLSKAHLDPAGVAIQGLDVAVLAEYPFAGSVFVAATVFEAGVEEGSFPAFVQGEMALEHVPVEGEGSQGWVCHVLGAGFGQGPEVGLDARRHAMVFTIDARAARVGGDLGFAGGRAWAGGFPGVGPIGREAAFGDLGHWHGSDPFVISASESSGTGPGGLAASPSLTLWDWAGELVGSQSFALWDWAGGAAASPSLTLWDWAGGADWEPVAYALGLGPGGWLGAVAHALGLGLGLAGSPSLTPWGIQGAHCTCSMGLVRWMRRSSAQSMRWRRQ